MSEKQTYQEKAEKLEALLKKAMAAAKKTIGIVEAGPSTNGLYRVVIGSKVTLLPSMHNLFYESGDTVIVVESDDIVMIEQKLPEELNKIQEMPEFEPVHWEDIAGIESQVERIRESIEFPLQNAKLFAEFNVPTIKGMMLYGPPGCGKTLIAKAIATSILKGSNKIDPKAFVYLKGGELLSQYVGAAEANIKSIFDSCREHWKKTKQRSVVFIDEAEAIVPTRGSRVSSDVDSTIVPTFLAEMDGFAEGSPFVILATNHPKQIDPAIQRPGRIDLKVEITRPTVEDAEKIFHLYLNKTLVSGCSLELAKSASESLFKNPEIERTASGALISSVVTQSVNKAIRRFVNDKKEKKGLIINDIEEVIEHFEF
jgi:SpoVK/Ycf46/Vps4 family AAA+-type ATPase